MNKIVASVILALSIAVPTMAADQPAVEKETAIVHFDSLKDAKLDGTVKDMRLMPAIGPSSQTPYIRLVNDMLTPRTVTVKILGLNKPQYDLYIFDTKNHGNLHPVDPKNPPLKPIYLEPKLYYAGKRTAAELAEGFDVPFQGTSMALEYRDYFSIIKPRCDDRVSAYQTAAGEDAQMCRIAANSVSSWIQRLHEADSKMRAMSIVVIPAGDPFSVTGGGILEPSADFMAGVRNIGTSIQILRKNITKKVRTAMYQADMLDALTPISMATRQVGKTQPGAKITYYARLDNQTDQPVTGKVKLITPTGWKTEAPAQSISLKPFQKNVVAKISVTAPKTAKSGDQIGASASLMVQDVPVTIQGHPVESR